MKARPSCKLYAVSWQLPCYHLESRSKTFSEHALALSFMLQADSSKLFSNQESQNFKTLNFESWN